MSNLQEILGVFKQTLAEDNIPAQLTNRFLEELKEVNPSSKEELEEFIETNRVAIELTRFTNSRDPEWFNEPLMIKGEEINCLIQEGSLYFIKLIAPHFNEYEDIYTKEFHRELFEYIFEKVKDEPPFVDMARYVEDDLFSCCANCPSNKTLFTASVESTLNILEYSDKPLYIRVF